jgi:folate-binding protein YgfZ
MDDEGRAERGGQRDQMDDEGRAERGGQRDQMDEVGRLYEVARADGVVVDRTGRGLLRLTGPQAVWFLQQTITADVEDLALGAWRESAFLTLKGKLVSHFRVGRTGDDELWLDIDPPANDLADWLVKYRFRTKVEIEDRTTSVTTVVGARAAELAPPGAIAVTDDAVIFGDTLGDVAVADVHGALNHGLESAPPDVLETLRIEAGVPRFGVDYTTDHLPQEAGLTSIVPIDKGCYVGQETVARIHFRGHVNKVARPMRLDGVDDVESAAGRELDLNGARVGVITSAARSPRAGDVAIGMVRVEPSEGAAVDVEGGGVAILGPVPAGTKVKTG